MGLLTATTKAALAQCSPLSPGAPHILRALEIDLPQGLGTVVLSKDGFLGKTAGAVPRANVVTWGRRTRQVADRGGSISACTFGATISDEDFWFSNMLGKGYRLSNSTVRWYLWPQQATSSDYYLGFGGVLSEWSVPKDGQFVLGMRTNDSVLKTKFPRMPLGPIDWPNIDKSAIGVYPNIIYGKHDDAGSGNHGQNQGAVTCPLVDATSAGAYKTLVSLGYTTPLRAYISGTRQTSGFTIQRGIVNGRYWTWLQWTSKPSGPVTVDVEGYESVGDGTGTLIIEATDVIAHLLSNFVFAEYQQGIWLSTNTTYIDTTALAAAKLFLKYRAAGGGYAACKVLNAQQTGEQMLTLWLASMELKAYWSPAGKIVIKADSPTVKSGQGNTWSRTAWLDFKQHAYSVGRPKWPSQSQAGRIYAPFQNIQNGNQKYFPMEVAHPYRTTDASDTISLDFGPSCGP